MFNKVILIGNLTRDPELRYTPNGKAVAKLGLAVNTAFSRSDEEGKDETLFIDITVWGKQAESCSQYLSKGRQILVEGRLQERKWETEGQQKRKMEVVASNVRFMGRKGEEGSQGGGSSSSPQGGGNAPDEVSDIEPF